jgi:hypothetical protein
MQISEIINNLYIPQAQIWTMYTSALALIISLPLIHQYSLAVPLGMFEDRQICPAPQTINPSPPLMLQS